MGTIRVGTASPATQASRAATLALIERLARRAASPSHTIDVLVLPEALLGGYPRGSSFGSVVGERSARGRDEFAHCWDEAIDLGDTVGEGGAGAGTRWLRRELPPVAVAGARDGCGHGHGSGHIADGSHDDAAGASRCSPARGDGTREELERIARDTGLFIVTGLVEKAGGSMYCAVVYVCPREGIIGKRRKVMPTGTERLVWAQGSPATLAAVSTTIRGTRVNLAAAICWENYMPLLRQALYAQNVNLYLAPTADGRDSWLGLMRTIGIEGRCFVVSSNMCVRAGTQAQGQQHQQHSVGARRGPAARRNSMLLEDGFEIALPPSPQRHKRRKSVFDEDGNEIVLCCDADDDAPSSAPAASGPAPAPAPAPATDHVDGRAAALATKSPVAAAAFASRGGSCIISPFGDVLAGPQWEDDDGILHADVDMRDCIRGRLDLDAAGSYSRNDSFCLTVQGLDLDPLPY